MGITDLKRHDRHKGRKHMKHALCLAALLLLVMWVSGCSFEAQVGDVEPVGQTGGTQTGARTTTPAPATPTVISLETGSEYDGENLLATSTTFSPDTPEIYMVAEIAGIEAGQVITGTLLAVYVLNPADGSVIEDYEVVSNDQVAPGSEVTVVFTFSAPDAGWPVGDYEGILLIDGEESESVDLVVVPDA
jgi:hypothetical protein